MHEMEPSSVVKEGGGQGLQKAWPVRLATKLRGQRAQEVEPARLANEPRPQETQLVMFIAGATRPRGHRLQEVAPKRSEKLPKEQGKQRLVASRKVPGPQLTRLSAQETAAMGELVPGGH
jgi:hypothetical protein